VAKGLSPAQAKAYRVADNQTSSLSDWDFAKLEAELASLKLDGYDLANLGFNEKDLNNLLNPSCDVEEDEVPAPPDEAVTQPGDLCGSSTVERRLSFI
jgi:hypothetical protein